MSFLKTLLGRGWRERNARGDEHRSSGELGPALADYEDALAAFDGSREERETLTATIAEMRSELRAASIAAAKKLATSSELDEAGYELDSAFDRSTTEEERAEIEGLRDELFLQNKTSSALSELGKPRGKGRGGAFRPTINYLVTRQHKYTMADYLASWGSALADQIGILPYDALANLTTLPEGVYIFSDLERLTDEQRALLALIWQRLEQAEGEVWLLNHPLHAMRRYELLKTLAQSGQNSFDVYWLNELPRPLTRPVFLRHADEHEGALSDIIEDDEQLDGAITQQIMAGIELEEIMAVEYCETADEHGLYRKYSAFRIGDIILPRHMIASENWLLKRPDLLDNEFLDEDREYVDTNPHQEQLRHIFETARIDYGRIDYSLLDGEIQVWEINTNPIVMARPDRYRAPMLPLQERYAPMMQQALETLAPQNCQRRPLDVSLDGEEIQRIVRRFGPPSW